GDDRGAQARAIVGDRVFGRVIDGKGRFVGGDATDDRAGLEIAEKGDGLGPGRFVPSGSEDRTQLRPGAGLTQEVRRVEGRAVELEQGGGLTVEGDAAPRLSPQAYRGMALNPAGDPRVTAHGFSNWSTIVRAARDSLGRPFFALSLGRADRFAARASRSWILV